jgi:hypothetical protein
MMNIHDVPKTILDVLQLKQGTGDEWPEPEEISRPLAPVPEFDPDMLPDVLHRRAYDISHRIQCPVDFVAAAMLVTLGSIIGSRCAVRPKQYDDWTEYPNIWGGVISPPGHLKTPAINEVMRLFHRLEQRARDEHDQAMVLHVATTYGKEANLGALKKQMQDRVKKGGVPTLGDPLYRQMAELKAEEKEPPLKRYRTNDATVEKLAELCVENPQGLLVVRDELVGLLASLVKEGKEGDRAFYLEAWNGSGTFRQDRIGRGSIVVDRLCLSLFGSIQPMRLQAYMYGPDGLQHDGMLQRFQVMVYPDTRRERQMIDQSPDRAAEEAVDALVEELAYMTFVVMGAAPGEGRSAPYYRFNEEAQLQFYDWLVALDRKIDDAEFPLMAEHLSKYRKLVPAIALIFHLVEIAATGRAQRAILFHHLQRAMKWAEYLEAHARRIFGQVGDVRLVAAQALQRKIKEDKLSDGFSERDVYRAGWGLLDGAEIVGEACAELVAAGWLRPIHEKSKTKPRSPKYQINPKLVGREHSSDRQN